MKPPPFEYHLPRTVPEAVALLSQLDNAKVLAGGQSLMAMLNLRFVHPDHLIDINRIPELDAIEIHDRTLRIGAMTRQHRIEIDPEVQRTAPILSEALRQVGHRQTRNRGTLGGSLCHLDPAAELPAVALLYDATIHLTGPSGERTVPMADFMAGYMTPALQSGELVTAVDFPLWPERHGYAFTEFSRRHGDFAIAGVACLLESGPDGRIVRAAIAVMGVESLPLRLTDAEAILTGMAGDGELYAKAAEHCLHLNAIADVHAGEDYRRGVAAAMVRRALAIAYARATGETPQ